MFFLRKFCSESEVFSLKKYVDKSNNNSNCKITSNEKCNSSMNHSILKKLEEYVFLKAN